MRTEGRRGLRAPNSGTEEVLERNCRCVDARELGGLRVVRGEGQLDPGVVDGVARGDVRVQILCYLSVNCDDGLFTAKGIYSKE